jgi:hypothetical protein
LDEFCDVHLNCLAIGMFTSTASPSATMGRCSVMEVVGALLRLILYLIINRL